MNLIKRFSLTLVVIIMMVMSLSIAAYPQQYNSNGGNAVVVKEGDDVIQTIDKKIYVGRGIAFQGPWVTLYHVKFPVPLDGIAVGVVVFPSERVKLIYHKGAVETK